MPMDQVTADNVNKKVREFLKTGRKSTNKWYTNASESTTYTKMVGDTAVEKVITPEMKAKRNKSLEQEVQLELNKLRASRKDKNGSKTPVAYGELLSKEVNPLGNCMELVCLVIYFLSDTFKSSECYMAEIADPGDHVFCVVAPKTPTAKNIAGLKDETDAWVIDPWANVACPAPKYTELLREKFKKWATVGKRVSYKTSKDSGWTDPTEVKYQVSIFFSNLTYTAGNKKFAGL